MMGSSPRQQQQQQRQGDARWKAPALRRRNRTLVVVVLQDVRVCKEKTVCGDDGIDSDEEEDDGDW